ncbi:MAG: E3 ubiquitin ligase family protein, partial [Candidatus Pacebacteria bacterium]|nr:E3 ubiquitin ligase family protein [Candidatus Paceibacterota bacterium]
MKRISIWTVLGTVLLVCFFIVIAASKRCDWCYEPPTMAAKFIACGLVIIAVTLYYRWQFKEHESIVFDIESLPSMKTDDVVEGVPFAGTGKVSGENGQVMTAPFSGLPCVYFHSIMEQYVRQGKHSRWEVIQNDVRFIPFHLEDERGNVNIDLTNIDEDFSDFKRRVDDSRIPNPRHSEVECRKVLDQVSYRDPKATVNFFGITSGRRLRRTESILQPGTKVFVCGMGGREAGGQLVLREDAKCPLIITTKTREDFVAEFYKGSGLIFWSYIFIAAGFSLSFWAANYYWRIGDPVFYLALAI